MRRGVLFSIAGAIVLIGAGATAAGKNWPFTQAAAARSLSNAFAATATFGTFRETFFPHPGFIAQNVHLVPSQGADAGDASISTLRAEANWSGLIRHHLRRLLATNLSIRVRSLGEGIFVGSPDKNVIDEIDLSGAAFQIGGDRFDFKTTVLENVGTGRKIRDRIDVAIPRPPGRLEMRGDIGPFVSQQFAATPLSGSYRLTGANLAAFSGIAGILQSTGTFRGTMSQLTIDGKTDIPDFSVVESRHAHHLSTEFHAVANATNGDMVLPTIHATLDQTAFDSTNARVEGSPSKTVTLDFDSRAARIEDLMLLFIKAPRSPIRGTIRFRAHVELPPGNIPFKRRVRLAGSFEIAGATFTSSNTQANADELSTRAQGEPDEAPQKVPSELAAHVALRNGIATFHDLSFRVPGASAHLDGTFSLVTERIDLHGKLATEAELSQTTTGFKSALLKLLDPIFKHKRAGAVIPVSVDGTYNSPAFHEVFTK